MVITIPREKTEFVLPEGMISFPTVFPGQAEKRDKGDGMVYGCEWVGNLFQGSPIEQAVCVVAQTYAPNNWQAYVYGRDGAIKRLEDYPKRDPGKYPYAVGKFVLGLKKTISLKFLKMEGANLTDPVQRARFDQGVAAHAPNVYRFPNLANPADLQKIEQENQRRLINNLTPYKESEYNKVFLTVEPHELWAGCIVRVQGRAFWYDGEFGKGISLGLEQILLVRQGERLVGEVSPDKAFGEFAPPADLAPPAPQFPGAPPPPPMPPQQGNLFASLF